MRIRELTCMMGEVRGATNGLVCLTLEDVSAGDLLACLDDATEGELRELALGLVDDLPGRWEQVEDEDGRPTRELTLEERYALGNVAIATEELAKAFNRK